MKTRCINLKDWQVRGLLDGSITDLWVPVKLTQFGPSPTRGYDWTFRDKYALWNDVSTDRLLKLFSPYQPGDVLIGREKFRAQPHKDCSWGQAMAGKWLAIEYAAGGENGEAKGSEVWGPGFHVDVSVGYDQMRWGAWQSSSSMPREFARIHREIVSVEVRQVQSVTDAEAVQAGAKRFDDIPVATPIPDPCRWSMGTPTNTDQCLRSPRWAFANMINSTYGKSAHDFGPWDRNGWFWRLTTKEAQ